MRPGCLSDVQNVEVFEILGLPCAQWVRLPDEDAKELHRVLASTSILTVQGDRAEPALVLVQEEGMESRPSLLLDLSPAEILRYWSLLTAAQRAQFIEGHGGATLLGGEGAHLVARFRPLGTEGTFFDRFAGIFLAFGCLERSVREALKNGNHREATYRLFGRKYDSLGSLLQRLLKDTEEGKGDIVEHYVMALSSPATRPRTAEGACGVLGTACGTGPRASGPRRKGVAIRDRLGDAGPAEMPDFLKWFEPWFVRKAAPVEVEAP